MHLRGFPGRSHRAPDTGSGRTELFYELPAGAPEGERDDVRVLAPDEVELRLPVVVRPARLTGGDAVPRGLAGQGIGIRGDPRLVDPLAHRIEDVHPERL